MVWSLLRAHSSRPRTFRKTFAPYLESLEDRTVPSTLPVPGTGTGTFDPATATWFLRRRSGWQN